MSTEKKGIEFIVGLFLIAGFAAIGALVITFGRTEETFTKFYEIKVEFPNASGIIKGADVILSGAKVGKVAQAPELVEERFSVMVPLKIREDVKVPRRSFFQIRTSGMLGDSYVDVVPPAQYDPQDIAKPGELIAGTRSGGFDDITAKGAEMIDKLNTDILRKLSEELDALKIVTNNVNQRLLTEKNLQNIEVTFENLRTTSKEFVETAKQLDEVVVKSREAVSSASGTLKTIDKTANDLSAAIGDFRKTADSATKTVDTAKSLLQRVNNGEGALGMLLTDRETAENLRSLIANLRRSGVLFYKDRAAEERATPTPIPRSKPPRIR